MDFDALQHSKSSLGIGSLSHYLRHYARMALAGAGIQKGKPASQNLLGKGYVAKLHEIEISEMHNIFFVTKSLEKHPLVTIQDNSKVYQLTSLERRASMLRSILGFTVDNFIERNCKIRN